ncbi:MAG: hypothetical protein DI535_10125 [Citrobacter freundii]|nr:MAG: hypothetical protein DI535_10125 [Citrobacter freundii]
MSFVPQILPGPNRLENYSVVPWSFADGSLFKEVERIRHGFRPFRPGNAGFRQQNLYGNRREVIFTGKIPEVSEVSKVPEVKIQVV